MKFSFQVILHIPVLCLITRSLISDECFTMDLAVAHRRWTTHPARMRFPRRDFGLVSVGERLIAIGGEGDTQGQCDDSVDEYNEASGNWDKSASLPTSLKGCC